MDPTPIPDEEVFEGHERVVIGPPRGHSPTGDIRSIEALVGTYQSGRVYRTRWLPSQRDIERMQQGEPIWVTQFTPQMVVFDVNMADEK